MFENPPAFSGGHRAGSITKVCASIVYKVERNYKVILRKSWKIADFANESEARTIATLFARDYSHEHGLSRNEIRLISPAVMEMKVGGLTTIFDANEYDRIKDFAWSAQRHGRTYYVKGRGCIAGRRTHKYLHQILTNAMSGQEVDHDDHNGLNNLSTNLKAGTTKDNRNNCIISKANRSGFPGVHRTAYPGQAIGWVASWRENGERRTKWFSVKDGGEENAKAAAVRCRQEMASVIGCRNGRILPRNEDFSSEDNL